MSITPSVYTKNDPVYLNTPAHYEQPKEYFKFVVKNIKERFGDRRISLIDMGCASGAFVYHATKTLAYERMVGVDISDEHLKQARQYVPKAEFYEGSLATPDPKLEKSFDVVTCLGVMSIFDDTEPLLRSMISLLKPQGSLYILDIVNDKPIDMLMRYRRVTSEGPTSWESGLNIRSLATYDWACRQVDKRLQVLSQPFRMPFPLTPQEDPMRSWTIKTEHEPHQLVVGTGQMLNFHLIEIRYA